ncbi:MAG: patatin-like phospholipase family protein [Hyphomicrobiales bacterium]
MPQNTTPVLNLIAELSLDARLELRRIAQRVELPAGKVLFEQGDHGNSVYLVTSGSLGTYVRDDAGGMRLMALVRPGETVGEMSLISGQSRSATVIAIRDTEMLRLSKGKFDRLLESEPTLSQGLNKLLVHRLRQVTSGETTHHEPKTIAFIPAGRAEDTFAFAEELSELLQQNGYSVLKVTQKDISRTSRWFSRAEARHDFVFMYAEQHQVGWWKLCTRQADRVLIVADANDREECDLPNELLEQRAQHQLLDLVLLHPRDIKTPTHGPQWRQLLNVNRHFHIRRQSSEDLQRMMRLLLGQSVGLVLSGGGARAYAHVGVLKALEEANIPVDFVGGTSMGSIIAACCAVGWSAADIEANVREAFVSSNPLSDYTLPLTSLVGGRIVARRFDKYFGKVEIHDLWRPYFCISANLTNGTTEIHEDGKLVDALMASIALPGVLPPRIHDVGVLADGGILNNLPADVMRGRHRGPIIAVDVARDHALTPEDLRREINAPLWRRMTRPVIVSVLMRAGTITHETSNRARGELADLWLQPPLGDVDIRNWKAFDETVALGYNYTRDVLNENAQLLRPPLGFMS